MLTRIRAWVHINLAEPFRQLDLLEQVAAICIGVHCGLFPVPGCTLACQFVQLFIMRLLVFQPTISKLATNAAVLVLATGINAGLAPVQLALIPIFMSYGEVLIGVSLRPLVFDPGNDDEAVWNAVVKPKFSSLASLQTMTVNDSVVMMRYIAGVFGFAILLWFILGMVLYAAAFILVVFGWSRRRNVQETKKK